MFLENAMSSRVVSNCLRWSERPRGPLSPPRDPRGRPRWAALPNAQSSADWEKINRILEGAEWQTVGSLQHLRVSVQASRLHHFG